MLGKQDNEYKQEGASEPMSDLPLAALETFIVHAKQHTYAGDGQESLPYRSGSRDLQYAEGDWAYHDSYFGECDFIGQEIVYFQGQPVWGMNYFGMILHPDKITAAQAGAMLKQSLSRLYLEGRFLGAFAHQAGALNYVDQNEGDARAFRGKEQISRDDQIVYELVYHGGLLHA